MNTKHISTVFAGERALSSVVEHYLHTVGVAGSKPAARTISFSFKHLRQFRHS